MPMTSLLDYVDEDQVKVFLEKMTAEKIDLKAFFTNDLFELACVKSQWKSAFTLHALGYCRNKENQGKEIEEILIEAETKRRGSSGIVHVVEHPALEPLLEEWAAAAAENEKEAAEKKIDDIFDDVDVKVLFIQVGDSQREQLSGIVKEWNRGRNNKGEWNCFSIYDFSMYSVLVQDF